MVSLSDITKHGGAGLLQYYYGGSLIKALQTVYPEHSWKHWRFTKPHNVATGSNFSKVQYLLFQHIQRVSTRTILADLSRSFLVQK